MCKNLGIPFGYIKSVREAGKILDDVKPDIVFSKGGFVALPVVRAAAKRGITVIAHESDVSLGLANKLSMKHCAKIYATFEKTAIDYGVVHTGAPIRQCIYNGDSKVVIQRHFVGTSTPGVRNLLVVGGSLGAARINDCVRGAVGDLGHKWNVIHICGRGKIAGGGSNQYIQIEYVDDMENYLVWADVVVSRAGSNALCELAVLGKPTLFIPLSTGRGDQIQNVEEVSKHGGAQVLFEEDLNPQTLIKGIQSVWEEREKYSRNIKLAIKDGTRDIAIAIHRQVTCPR